MFRCGIRPPACSIDTKRGRQCTGQCQVRSTCRNYYALAQSETLTPTFLLLSASRRGGQVRFCLTMFLRVLHGCSVLEGSTPSALLGPCTLNICWTDRFCFHFFIVSVGAPFLPTCGRFASGVGQEGRGMHECLFCQRRASCGGACVGVWVRGNLLVPCGCGLLFAFPGDLH